MKKALAGLFVLPFIMIGIVCGLALTGFKFGMRAVIEYVEYGDD